MIKRCLWDPKKSRFIKKQEASGLWSNLGLKTPLSEITLKSDVLIYRYKMNETVNKYLLVADRFMSDMYLRQPGFIYSVSGPFTKTNKEYKNLKKQEIQDIFINTK